MAAKKKSTHSSPSPSRRFRFNEVLFFVRVTPPPMTNERTNDASFVLLLLLLLLLAFFFRGGVGGDVLRDEFVCVAKSFFLFFFWRFVRTRTR